MWAGAEKEPVGLVNTDTAEEYQDMEAHIAVSIVGAVEAHFRSISAVGTACSR